MRRLQMVSMLIVTLYMFCMLTACQSAPSENVVSSKNDGSFDIAVVQTATETYSGDMQKVKYKEEFSSTDGSVSFAFDIEQEIEKVNLPVIEIEPYFITEEDAKRVANVLFEGAACYESILALDSDMLSRESLQEKISRWSNYTNTQAVQSLFPYRNDYPQYQDEIVDAVKNAIEYYTELYEKAPKENQYVPCDWTFKPESQYLFSEDELRDIDLTRDNESIEVMLRYENIPYFLSFTKRDRDDYKICSIFAYPHTGNSPKNIDYYIFRAELCRTEKPSEETMLDIRNKAQALLDNLGLGSWEIDGCDLVETVVGDNTEYTISVSAVPVIGGMPAGRRDQSMNLLSESVFSSNYYISDVNIQYSANGDLIHFEMQSPIETKALINDNVATLDIDELMQKARVFFTHSDSKQYGAGAVLNHLKEPVSCDVLVSNLECALTRVKVPNTDESYYYVPSVSLYGSIENIGKDTGNVYYRKDHQLLLTLNAIDGTIINSTNE